MLKLDEGCEVDETYINAGLKGKNKRNGKGRIRGCSHRHGGGTYTTDRPPIFTLVGRKTRTTVFKMKKRADAKSAKLVINSFVVKGNTIYTDDYRSYHGLHGYDHLSVPHSKGIYAAVIYTLMAAKAVICASISLCSLSAASLKSVSIYIPHPLPFGPISMF